MSYQKILDELYNLQSNAIKLGLERIIDLSARFDNPERKFPVIHVAGSKGKGSTASILSSILTASGYKTGLFTSPHVSDYAERFRIDGRKIPHKEVVALFRSVYDEVIDSKATFFETTAFLAFYYFMRQKVDAAVIEVGMGGRLDATNVVHPVLSIITEIDMEHKKALGRSLKKIAGEKAGIIKEGVPCIFGVTKASPRNAVRRRADELHAPVYDAFASSKITFRGISKSGIRFDYNNGELTLTNARLSLTGAHQLKNTQVAIEAAKLLTRSGFERITKDSIKRGLARVRLEARIEHIKTDPPVILDVCHTVASAQALVDTVKKLYSGAQAHIIFGVMRDKNYKGILEVLSAAGKMLYFIMPDHRRSLDTKHLAAEADRRGIPYTIPENIAQAVKKAHKCRENGELIICAGSFYFLDEIKKVYKRLDKEVNSV